MRREVMTLTAQGRASALVVACIPIGLALAISVLNPNYLRPLIETDLGRMFVVAAIVLELVGFIIIRRIVNIQF